MTKNPYCENYPEPAERPFYWEHSVKTRQINSSDGYKLRIEWVDDRDTFVESYDHVDLAEQV